MMTEVKDYYSLNKRTASNSKDFDLALTEVTSFPSTLYIGELEARRGTKVPALLPMKEVNGLCFLSIPENAIQVHHCMESIALRMLLSLPAGLCKMTLYDGAGLGANLISLSNLSPRIKGEHILTDPNELKRSMLALNNDVSNIVQKVLGTQYADLKEYNESVGDLALPYHVLILSDFPNTLGREHCEMVEKIVRTGRRAGVFVIMNIDTSCSLSPSYDPLPLIQFMTTLFQSPNSSRWYVKNFPYEDWFNKKFILKLTNDFPSAENVNLIVEHINQKQKNRIKKDSVDVTTELTIDNLWKKEASRGVVIPIGKVNSSTFQNFILSFSDDENDAPHHCLIGGATGSGKTVLLHNIICNGAWLYSPDNLQFILLDYKEGTEFKIYENLPHVKVLSMRSEVEYGMSVFRYLYGEIERRGDLFKQLDVSNLQKYNSKADNKLPRILVVIDEFQKLLDGNASSSGFVSSALDDIGRRGRSFGINLILSTQSLSGVNISQALSHLGLRICLKLNSSKDCDQLLGLGNHVPFTTLTKAGEGVYNARSGLIEGNQRFQGSYINDERLVKIISNIKDAVVRYYHTATPFNRFLYDGEVAASIKSNPILINGGLPINEKFCDVYIGEPAALIESHTKYRLSRQNGANVLIIGGDQTAATALLYHSIKQIMEQSEPHCECYICDKTNIDSEWHGCLKELTYRHNNYYYEDDAAIEQVINKLSDRLERRKVGKEDRDRTLLVLSDMYNIRSMRKSGFTVAKPTQQMQNILRDGPSYGIHTIVYFKSFTNFSAVLDPLQSLQEFDIRIEIRGGEGYKMFGTANIEAQKSSPKKQNIAVIQSSADAELQKFKVYILEST